MSRGQEEFRLQCVVADWLRLALPASAIWSAFPAGENRSATTGARLKRMGLARGWPDLLIFSEGLLVGIELKIGPGKQSPEQRAVAAAWAANGGLYDVCRSLDDVETLLRGAGLPLMARALPRRAA